MRIYLPLFLLLFSFIIAGSAFAQKISGRVLNEGGKAASHVTVQFKDGTNRVMTSTDGSFTIVAKTLPDTLFFSASGYEPYKVMVSGVTVKDTNFAVVLLSTRSKTTTTGVVINTSARINTTRNFSPATTRNYISGKKLFMLDSMPLLNGGVIYKAGLLTAGEVNDFNKWRMWEDFQESEFKTYSDHWGLYPKQRYSVLLQNKDHISIIGQPVFLINKKTNDTVWSAVTDNTGKAELWADMKGLNNEPDYLIACKGGTDIHSPSLFSNGVNKMELNTPCSVSNTVDIVVAVDATGSMGDEIDFLKIELEDVIRNTFARYPDLDLHIGSVFYRDKTDEYIVRHIDFQTDLLKVLNFIKLQRAAGGGDVPEAIDIALQTALDSLHWGGTARSRILFLVSDAPPHDEAKERMFTLIQKAAAKGVRIVPVVCSGADKSTEFIMRSMALATNGDYVFLTDDSGTGFSHTKPTTDFFPVGFFNLLLERIIKQMLFANSCSEQKEVESFNNISANIENIKVYPNPAQGSITIESKNHLKEIFITDLTGKILMRLETNEKQNKWTANLSAYPNATYLVKYITADDQWGGEKVVLIH